MGRFIWPMAGLCMAIENLVDAVEGPRGPLAGVDPTAWTILFLLAAAGWVWLAVDAARGRF